MCPMKPVFLRQTKHLSRNKDYIISIWRKSNEESSSGTGRRQAKREYGTACQPFCKGGRKKAGIRLRPFRW